MGAGGGVSPGSYEPGKDCGALLASRDFLDQVWCSQVPSESLKDKHTWYMECYFSSKDSLV